MNSIKRITSMALVGAFAFSVMVGCSSNPSEEEIKAMEEDLKNVVNAKEIKTGKFKVEFMK